LKDELNKLKDYFSKINCKFKIISSKHIPEIRREIRQLYIDEKITKELYNYVLKYFKFNISRNLYNERYIIVVAIPQKSSIVTLNMRKRKLDVIIPPTYVYKLDQDKIYKILLKIFKDVSKISYAYLPKKLIAVRSGLAEYGRNNICYIKGMGSFNRLETYYIDFPLNIDNWFQESMMKECNNCSKCITACPNKCIRENKFVIKAENCLTYFNENLNDFPDWIDNSSHNALIGCMICQNVCPVNKNYKNKEKISSISKKELDIILNGLEKNNLTEKLEEKLKNINMDEYISVLPRNIKVLMR
jgi:epoxyqueuosine reductase